MEFEKLCDILAEVLGVDPKEISEETTLADDLGADSLDVVEMMMALEEEFGVTIDDEKIRDLKTVSDVVNCVESMI